MVRHIAFLVTLLAPVSSARAQPATVNDLVLKFCQDHLGEKVGDGECASLADAALKSAGAKLRSAFKKFPNPTDSVWGELVYTLEMKNGSRDEKKIQGMSVKPGDVIQLGAARFEGKNYFLVYPIHTSIVLDVKDGGNVLKVLEQNVNVKKTVVETTYRLNDLKTGWVRIYRPVPK